MVRINHFSEETVTEWFTNTIDGRFRSAFFLILDNKVPFIQRNGMKIYTGDDLEKAFEKTIFKWAIQLFRVKMDETLLTGKGNQPVNRVKTL
jgi:hypothetical protein